MTDTMDAAETFAQAYAPLLTESERARQCRRCGALDQTLRDDDRICGDVGLCDWRVDAINAHARLLNPPACVMCGRRDMALSSDGACFMRKCVDDYARAAVRLLRLRKLYRARVAVCPEPDCPRGPYDAPKAALDRIIACKFKSACIVGQGL